MFFEHLSPYNDSDTGLDSGSVQDLLLKYTNRKEDPMGYPEKVSDLKPSELSSPPVVNHLVDVFERLGGGAPRREVVAYRRPLTDEEADKALKIAQDDWVRLAENYDRALSQFTPLLLSEINGWAIKENKPLVPIREAV